MKNATATVSWWWHCWKSHHKLVKLEIAEVESEKCSSNAMIWDVLTLGKQSGSPGVFLLSPVPCAASPGDWSLKEKEFDTINSHQTLIATFVYLSFLRVLALHQSLQLRFLSLFHFHWPAAFFLLTTPSEDSPTPAGPAGKSETPRAHPGQERPRIALRPSWKVLLLKQQEHPSPTLNKEPWGVRGPDPLSGLCVGIWFTLRATQRLGLHSRSRIGDEQVSELSDQRLWKLQKQVQEL